MGAGLRRHDGACVAAGLPKLNVIPTQVGIYASLHEHDVEGTLAL